MENEICAVEKLLCDYLGGMGEVFLPETWRDGAACVSMTGGQNVCRVYVDGSYRTRIPFDVRIRRVRCANSVFDKLEAALFFERLTAYIGSNSPPHDGWCVMPSSCKSGICAYSKAAVYDDGTEEYRAGYVLEIHMK